MTIFIFYKKILKTTFSKNEKNKIKKKIFCLKKN